MPDGQPVEEVTLKNSKGSEVRIITYGATVVSLKVPDQTGAIGDVVLGYDNLDSYRKFGHYLGAIVGRYGNRIAKGQFTLGDQTYHLDVNNGPNSLHGGSTGFDKVVWKIVKTGDSPNGPQAELSYFSKDGEEGYPGNLNVHVTFTMTEDNALRLDFSATTDKDTVCNLTHHSYFNLAGKGDVLGYEVQINADKTTPADKTLIPTGVLKSVEGTPFDFRHPTTIGSRINAPDEQLKFGGGYDHNWVLNKTSPGKLELAARVYDPLSSRVMEVSTTQPGLQFYTANFLEGVTGKNGWGVSRALRLLHGAPALPRFAEPSEFPHNHAQAG